MKKSYLIPAVLVLVFFVSTLLSKNINFTPESLNSMFGLLAFVGVYFVFKAISYLKSKA